MQLPPDFDLTKLLDWGFLGLASRYAAKVSGSIEKLNVQIARLLERTEYHERELGHHEIRIEKLESKRK